MDVTMVTVLPEEGEFTRIARALLAAADHPQQVHTVSHPQAGFRVPEEVFDRFQATEQAAWEARDEPPVQAEGEPEAQAAAADDSVQPKRRGRPRKNPLPQQDSKE